MLVAKDCNGVTDPRSEGELETPTCDLENFSKKGGCLYIIYLALPTEFLDPSTTKPVVVSR